MRRLTRPERLDIAREELRSLYRGYEDWLEALPESQTEGSLADKLQETVDALQEALDQLDGIDPPKGFGRD